MICVTHDPTVGVRPESLFIAEDGKLAAKVSHDEQLGGDTNVIAHVNDLQITARLFGQHAISEGQDLRLGFDPASL